MDSAAPDPYTIGSAKPGRTAMLLRLALSAVLAAALSAQAGRAAEPAHVTVAISQTSSDVGIFVAIKRDYFRSEGIDVTTVPFDSAAKMVAPLGAGELDVGSGSLAAGVYNAVARGIKIEAVADSGSAPPGYGHNILLVRKDLIETGRWKVLQDFKGMTIALTSPGASSNATLNVALLQFGLKFADIEPVYMGYPEHVVALVNRKVDAGLTAEPAATQAIVANAAIRVTSDDVIDPYHQAAVILYSSAFAHDHPDTATRFMKAYLRGVRDYNDGLQGGRIAGPAGEAIISILTEYTKIKDPAVYRAISPQGCNPDGHVNTASLDKDLQFYRTQGWINGEITLDRVVDDRFVAAALKELAPYRRK
jgi:NitT/TauT family transport system substrate-binding protein